VLLPERDRAESAGGYTPNLLANALHGGRLRRHFRIETAAEMLGVSQVELEAVELAQDRPEDAFLDRVCDLYGLPVAEMRMLKQFGDAAPGMAKSLAHLQQVFSHIYHLIKCCSEGEERRVLDKIVELLDSSDLDHPLEPDASSDDVGLFLNRLSLHLVNALRDSDFRGKMFQMAGIQAEDGAGTRDPGLTERW
jgi:transcriptional regulator with XRE-family HTH domain